MVTHFSAGVQGKICITEPCFGRILILILILMLLYKRKMKEMEEGSLQLLRGRSSLSNMQHEQCKV